MTDLTEFLLARIAEDEGRVGEVFPFGDMGEDQDCDVLFAKLERWDEQAHSRACAYQMGAVSDECSCGWPARLLAECGAKRRIVALHPMAVSGVSTFSCCDNCDDVDTYDHYPCATLRLLASPYADHPDYRQEWAL